MPHQAGVLTLQPISYHSRPFKSNKSGTSAGGTDVVWEWTDSVTGRRIVDSQLSFLIGFFATANWQSAIGNSIGVRRAFGANRTDPVKGSKAPNS